MKKLIYSSTTLSSLCECLEVDSEDGGRDARDISAIARSQFASFKDEESEVKHKLKLIMTYTPRDFLYIISHKSIFKS